MKAPARHFPWLYAVCAAALISSPASGAEVKLTGIMKMSGTKKAMLVVNDRHCNLSEGESQGPIEVLRIDEKNKQVTIRADGKQMDLSFEKDGVPRITTVAPTNHVVGTPPGAQPYALPLPQVPPQGADEAVPQEPAEGAAAENPTLGVGRARTLAPRSGPRGQRPEAVTPMTPPAVPNIPRRREQQALPRPGARPQEQAVTESGSSNAR